MQLLEIKCPACGAAVSDRITGRVMTCAYCGSRFVLDGEEAELFLDDIAEEEVSDDPLDALPMSVFASRVCEEFLSNTDPSRFKDTPKIRTGLGIPDGETVYLIHDDTMFHSGKDGFAVTEKGLYCRGMYEEPDFMDWAVFAGLPNPALESGSSYITCGTRNICYLTGARTVMEALFPVYQRLYRHAVKRNS